MSDIDWSSEDNVKVLENQLQMLKSSSSLFDIDIKHPPKCKNGGSFEKRRS